MLRWVVLHFVFITSSLHAYHNSEVFRGGKVTPFTGDIMRLINETFSEYPRLYVSSDDDYAFYLKSYANSDNSIVCMAFENGEAIGLVTGIPMAENRAHYQQPWVDAGQNLDELFYVGEIVVLPKYRGQGIGSRLYRQIEREARKSTHYKKICFCEMEIAANDPLRPENFRPNDSFWNSLGFTPQPELNFVAPWVCLPGSVERPHKMIYWTKEL